MKKVLIYLLQNHGSGTVSVKLRPIEEVSPHEIRGNEVISQNLFYQTGYIVADTIESAEKECDKIVKAWIQAMYN